MTVTIPDMHEHVMGFCAEHHIIYSWCRRPTEAWACRDLDEICIAPIKSSISYATALHELGHILGRYQRSRDSILRERWAWNWAKRNALVWTPVMDQNAVTSLGFAVKARRVQAIRAN
jgi:hypothetical protein